MKYIFLGNTVYLDLIYTSGAGVFDSSIETGSLSAICKFHNDIGESWSEHFEYSLTILCISSEFGSRNIDYVKSIVQNVRFLKLEID